MVTKAAQTGRRDMLEMPVKEPWSLAHVLRGESPLRRVRLRRPQWGPQGALVTAALLTAAALWFLSGTMPAPLILPVVSTLLLFGALVLALVAWRRPATRGCRITGTSRAHSPWPGSAPPCSANRTPCCP